MSPWLRFLARRSWRSLTPIFIAGRLQQGLGMKAAAHPRRTLAAWGFWCRATHGDGYNPTRAFCTTVSRGMPASTLRSKICFLDGRAMKNLVLVFTLAAFASLAFGQTATTADLSGTWKLNFAKSTLPKKPPTRPETVTISTEGNTIQFHHSGDPKDRLPTFIVDSKEHPIEIWAENFEHHFVKATWEKSVLVIQYIDNPTPGYVVTYY